MLILFCKKVWNCLCTTPVEKSVENVENSELSTVFPPVCNFRPRGTETIVLVVFRGDDPKSVTPEMEKDSHCIPL